MIGSNIQWSNKIQSADRFYHKGRMMYFICYYGDEEKVYPAGDDLRDIDGMLFQHRDGLQFIKADCKRVFDIYFNYKNPSPFKNLFINPYFFTL